MLGKWRSRDGSRKVVCELIKMVTSGHNKLEKKGISKNGNDMTSESMVY